MHVFTDISFLPVFQVKPGNLVDPLNQHFPTMGFPPVIGNATENRGAVHAVVILNVDMVVARIRLIRG